MSFGEVIDYGSDGSSVVRREDGKIVFIDSGVIGERVDFKELHKTKGVARGKLNEVVVKSGDRVEPPCPYAQECGGCSFQSVNYGAQLDWKRHRVKRELEKVLNRKVQVHKTFGLTLPLHYRNHMQFHIKNGKMGLYQVHSNEIVDIKNCPVQKDRGNEILAYVRKNMLDLFINSGVYLIGIRTNEYQEAALILVAKESQRINLDRYLSDLMALGVTNIVYNINPKGYDHYGRESYALLEVRPWREKVCQHEFVYDPTGFFQVNTTAQEHIIYRLRGLLNDEQTIPLVELFCGVGTLGLSLEHQGLIYGVEISEDAIKLAKTNAQNAGAAAEFYTGKAEKLYQNISREVDRHVLLVDPPRAGLHKTIIHTVKESRPEKIAYVSCNPATLARDVAQLEEIGYRLSYVEPMDMFPFTAHVETVTILKKL